MSLSIYWKVRPFLDAAEMESVLFRNVGSVRPESRNSLPWRRSSVKRFPLILLLSLTAALGAAGQEEVPSAAVSGKSTFSIHFEEGLDEAFEKASQSEKPVLLYFRAVWCPQCRKMYGDLLRSDELSSLADRFHWVDLALDRDLSIARAYGVESVPEFVLLGTDGRICSKLIGHFRPNAFAAELKACLARFEAGTVPAGGAGLVIMGDAGNPLIYQPKGYRGSSSCFSHVGYGPLNLHSQSPFQAMRLGLAPRAPSSLAKGLYELKATATWVNVWAHRENSYHLDYEMLQSTTSLVYGLTDQVEFGIEFEDRSRFGGVMDGFIQGFHNTFGISQGDRDNYPKGEFAFDCNGLSLTNADRGSFRQSISLSVQHNLSCGDEVAPAFSYALTARFKVNDAGDIRSDGPVDLGASVSLARRFGEFYTYAVMGYAYFGEESFYTIELERDQLSALVAGEWRYAPTQSIILQYLFSEGVAKGFSPFSKASHEVTLGWKGEISQDVVLEIGLIENVVTFDNSPDFGLHAGLVFRF